MEEGIDMEEFFEAATRLFKVSRSKAPSNKFYCRH